MGIGQLAWYAVIGIMAYALLSDETVLKFAGFCVICYGVISLFAKSQKP